jgi:general secretion pathway protein A
MFEQYFDFKENPFKLASDPAYFFLGRHHEEAIAHLNYAVLEGEGFIAITGEKGVGKTTVCRSFIEKLDENTEVAYSYKPASDPKELLKAINAEFGILSESEDAKDLTDSLNTFLMQKKMQGKKVAIFLDDAHSLNRDVLEQVRLISNLETTKDKLLQIILIGEPILTKMLTSQALRQIGQRVSVGYYIDAFNYDETMVYIQHRLSIASKGSSVRFDPKAVRRIFKYSGGIPRTINIACERALKMAFYRKEKLITGDIAEEAISHLAVRSETAFSSTGLRKMLGWVSAGCCLLLAISAVAVYIRHSAQETHSEQIKSEKPATITMPAPASVSETTPDAYGEAEIPVIKKNEPEKPVRIVAPVLPAKSPESTNENLSVEPAPSPRMTHSVQVGAFREGQYARQLVGELTAKGYPARIVPVLDNRQRTWLTVRIGDYPSHEAAKAEADAFSARENVQTAVRPFGRL